MNGAYLYLFLDAAYRYVTISTHLGYLALMRTSKQYRIFYCHIISMFFIVTVTQ